MIRELFHGTSAPVRVASVALLWLGLISSLHLYLNADPPVAARVVMGYMPVITNLAAPMVDAATRGTTLQYEAVKFASFAEMAEAFRSGHIQVAFIIAPLAIALHQQGVPLKIVYIGNRNESTLVVKKGSGYRTLSDLAGKTLAVPIRYSGHLLAVKRFLREHGLAENSVRIVEIPPPDMPAALASGGIDGYFVGEPFASKALVSGVADRMLDVESIWPRFICNLMIVREELVRSHPEWVQTMVSTAVRSGFWARDNVDEAVKLVSRYWGQDPAVVGYAFSQPPGRVRFDLYIPVREEIEEIAREMQLAGFIDGEPDIGAMVDDRFARAAVTGPVASFESISVW